MGHRTVAIFQSGFFLAMVFLLFFCCSFSAITVYAQPEQKTGWVEVQCDSIPEDFSDTATVVISNADTGEYYTVTCYKVNDYISRIKLPVGKYQVEQTSTADNFAFEALCETTSFEIVEDMPAAHLITLKIVKHDTSFELPETDESLGEEQLDTEDPLPANQSDESVPNDNVSDDAQETSNSVLDLLFSAASDEGSETSDEDSSDPIEDVSVKPTWYKIGIVLVGTVVFIIFIVVSAYFVRGYINKDE